jgi:hypothetical protein
MFGENDDFRPARTFPDFRKVTREMMGECYDACVKEMEAWLDTKRKNKVDTTPKP